jgi:hypothetical protein
MMFFYVNARGSRGRTEARRRFAEDSIDLKDKKLELVNKQREELAEAEVDEDGNSVDSLMCAYEFRMRMGERESMIDTETQPKSLKIDGDDWYRIPICDDDTVDSTK